MTQQPESRWSLNSTGNRVLLAVVAGLLVSFCASTAGMHGAARVVVFALVGLLTYVIATAVNRR